MKILVSNPDSIGDVILRQPMFAALRDAGHELLLVVRSFVAPIVPLVAPKVRMITLDSDPYAPDFNAGLDKVRRTIEAARAFEPDLYCIAPFQRTEFDEALAESLNGCRTVGMKGFLFPGVIERGLIRQSRIRLDREVPVSVEQHEAQKNEQLCSELLGRQLKLPDPVIRADKRHIAEARSLISHFGLEPGRFWIACVGSNQWTQVRNWALENWAKVLSHAVAEQGQKFLMIGTPDESVATEQIRTLMGPNGDATENLCDSPQPLAVTVALLHLSAGYIGRDTGPMHIAAALGKPVIAVFGGGTWPRFIPRAKIAAVSSMVMPCSGCDWLCHLRESYCVKRVPVETVLDAFQSIQSKNLREVRIEQIPMDPMLSARVIRESSQSCRDLRRRLAAAEHHPSLRAEADRETALIQVRSERDAFAESNVRLQTETAQLRSERDVFAESNVRLQTETAQLRAERDAFAESNVRLQAETAQLRAELESLSRTAAELQRIQYALTAVSDRLAASNHEIAQARTSSERLAEQLALLKAERDHMEAEVRGERIKAQSARREAEKVQKQAAAERQSILDVLNDLVVEHTALKQTADREVREAAEAVCRHNHIVEDYQQQLNNAIAEQRAVRQSISFRVGSTAGKPVVALLRMLRSLVSAGEKRS